MGSDSGKFPNRGKFSNSPGKNLVPELWEVPKSWEYGRGKSVKKQSTSREIRLVVKFLIKVRPLPR